MIKKRFYKWNHLITALLLSLSLLFANSSNDKIESAKSLAVRVLGEEKSEQFIFETLPDSSAQESFQILQENEKILIKGDTPVAMASGLNWYLKYFCNSHISWEARQINIPENLPIIEQPIVKTSIVPYSYYLNYCTFNYTMSFWDWDRWEKEIDWMALNGVDLPLAAVGSEAVWRNTLQRLGISEKKIAEFIPGPAFTAWWLMGNLEGWGGPVSNQYIDKQVQLQRKIIRRMRELGMEPVLPGFYGMVPNFFKTKYPEADIRSQGRWAGGFQRPAFLSPNDPLFDRIAQIYYEEQRKLFGEIHYFSGDPFHEGGNPAGIDLSQAGANIINGMDGIFSNSTWVFQGWSGNPKPGLLDSVNDRQVLILDLDCDNRPQWRKRNGWGKPWIWSIINNFGGNVGLFGRMDVIANEPFKVLQHSQYAKNLKGFGSMMEGIENNSVIYELLYELRWYNSSPDLDNWIKNYVTRRYGRKNQKLIEAYQILRNTVFGQELNLDKSQQGTSESLLCARPALQIERVSSWGTSQLYYNPEELLKAWKIYYAQSDKFKNCQGFNYDLVSVTRQVLANYSQVLHEKIVESYRQKNITQFNRNTQKFIELINDQDTLLNSIDNFMLGNWLEEAKDRATNKKEKRLFEFNARTLITTWSYQNSNLHDYSHREWGGLLKDFYKPRWEMFFQYLRAKLKSKETNKPDFYSFEKKWTNMNNKFPSSPIYNPVGVSQEIYNKYYNEIEKAYN